MDFAPRPFIGLGLVSSFLTIFGALILILFARSLLVGEPGLRTADLMVALGAAVLEPMFMTLVSWLAVGRFHGTTFETASVDGSPAADRSGMDRFDTFTEGARRALTLAQDESQRLKHNYMGTEHLLLGLIRERDGAAARALMRLGVDLEKVRTAVTFVIGRGGSQPTGEIGLTPRAKRVLELAIDESRNLAADGVGTEHLLLGLIREGEGVAAGVLQSLGVNLDRAHSAVLVEMGRGQSAE